MSQISEELLAEYFFDQHQNVPMDAAARAEMQALLLSDPELALRYARFEAQMQRLREHHLSEKMPDATRMRLTRNLARHVRLQQSDARPTRLRWLLVAAGVGAVMAIGVQRFIAPTGNSTLAYETNPTHEATFNPLTAFSAHMLDAQTVLANLSAAPQSEQQRLLDELIAQNRVFAKRAAAQGLPDVQRVLQAFEPVLTELGRVQSSPQRKQLLEQLDFETQVLANRWHKTTAQTEQTKIEL